MILLISAARYLERVKSGGALAARLEQVAVGVPGAPFGDLHLVQVDLAPPSRAAAAAVLDPLKPGDLPAPGDRKSTRLNSSHVAISYAVFCLKKKTKEHSW